MSIVKTYDVFCDGPVLSEGCPYSWWTSGVTGSNGTAQARRRARGRGWKHTNGRDLCPLCAGVKHHWQDGCCGASYTDPIHKELLTDRPTAGQAQ